MRLLVAGLAMEHQEDHRVSPEVVSEAGMVLAGFVAAVDTAVVDMAVALLDSLAKVGEDMIPVFDFPIVVEKHHMPRLSEVAVAVA